jgi:hypothetical protein
MTKKPSVVSIITADGALRRQALDELILMTDQLPAIIKPAAVTTMTGTRRLVPALIAKAGDQSGWRAESFTANIRNPRTCCAYARAGARFFAWCEIRGLILMTIRSFDVAAWVEQLQEKHGAPGVKLQLAAVRMLFD